MRIRTTQDPYFERQLPQHSDAERSVLGAILLDNKTLDETADLTPGDFFRDSHRRIFKAIQDLAENNQPIEIISLVETLSKSEELEAAGGIPYVSSLFDGLPRVSNVAHYTKVVREKALLRKLIHSAHAVQELAFDSAADLESVLDRAAQDFLDLAIEGAVGSGNTKTYREASVSLLRTLEERSVIKVMTGIDQLDRITGGFQPGELVTVTAGTGVGKTIMAQQIQRKSCDMSVHTLYCSGEMTAEHLMARALATEAKLDHRKMRRPETIEREEMRALVQAAAHECERCTILDGELSLHKIRLSARRMKRTRGIDCLIVDYDELVDSPGRTELDQQRNLTRGLKLIGIELNIPVIVISQLRKSVDKEDAKGPTLDRLYGSGAKSKHSSWILFLDRPYVRELQGSETDGTLFILKARDGRLAQIPFKFNLATLRFDNVPVDFVPPLHPSPAANRRSSRQRDGSGVEKEET